MVANIFALFFPQIFGLSGDVGRFCKKSSVYSQLTRVTDKQTYGQTHEKAISIAERLLARSRAID